MSVPSSPGMIVYLFMATLYGRRSRGGTRSDPACPRESAVTPAVPATYVSVKKAQVPGAGKPRPTRELRGEAGKRRDVRDNKASGTFTPRRAPRFRTGIKPLNNLPLFRRHDYCSVPFPLTHAIKDASTCPDLVPP